ncbi:MAG: hypothetical protein DIU83_07355, partial [Bacillota bacterium]
MRHGHGQRVHRGRILGQRRGPVADDGHGRRSLDADPLLDERRDARHGGRRAADDDGLHGFLHGERAAPHPGELQRLGNPVHELLQHPPRGRVGQSFRAAGRPGFRGRRLGRGRRLVEAGGGLAVARLSRTVARFGGPVTGAGRPGRGGAAGPAAARHR